MDTVARRSRHPAGHRGLPLLGQVRPGPPVPDGQLHAGGVAGGREVQEGDRRGRPELPPPHQGRGRAPRAAGVGLGCFRWGRVQCTHC